MIFSASDKVYRKIFKVSFKKILQRAIMYKSSFLLSPMSLSISLTCLSIGIIFHAYYPGNYSNPDMLSQFGQALNLSPYNDWHPPLMAWTWSILLKITNLTASMFILHTLILLASVICWTFIFNKLLGFRFSLFIPFLVLSPVITHFYSHILKDIGFAYYMLLACGVLTLGVIKNKISVLLLTTIFFLSFAALGTRLNGIFAIIPIVFFSSWFFFEKKKQKFLKSAVMTGIVMFGFVSCLHIFHYILNVRKSYPFQYVQKQDIIWISKTSGKNYLPESLGKLLEKHKNKDFRLVPNNWEVFLPPGDMSAIRCRNIYDCRRLTYAWIVSIVENPSLYLHLRWRMFKALFMGVSFPNNTLSFIKVRKENRVVQRTKELSISANLHFDNTSFKGLSITHWFITVANQLFNAIYSPVYILTGGFFWFHFLFGEVLIGMFVIQDKRLRTIILLLSSSGILYLLTYFFVVPAVPPRYLYWSIISGSFCVFFVIKGWMSNICMIQRLREENKQLKKQLN